MPTTSIIILAAIVSAFVRLAAILMDPTVTAQLPHDGEAGYHFGSHFFFRLGEYVSIRDEASDMHTFRVVSVDLAT